MNDRVRLSDHFTYKRLLRFVVPSVIMMIFTSVYGVVDGLFVSNCVGKDAFTAVNLIWPFIMLLSALGFMLGTGGSAVTARALGEKRNKEAREYFSSVVCCGGVGGTLLGILGILFSPFLASFVGAEGETYDFCVIYGRILFAALPAFTLQNMFQSLFVTAEKPELGLIVTAGAGLSNIFFDFLLVAVFDGGIIGAAVATAMSQIVGGILPLFYFINKNDSLLRLVKPRFDIRVLLKACGNGSSELMTNLSLSLVNILYNFQLMKLMGNDGIAAYGVIMYVNFVFISAFLGYSVGSAPIISFKYGAADTAGLKNVFKKSIIIISAGGAVMFALAFASSGLLADIFVGYDRALAEMTGRGFRIYSVSFLIVGFGIYSSAFFTALENGAVSALLSFLRTFLFQVAAVLILPEIIGGDGVWFAVTVAESAAFLASIIAFISERKRYNYI